MEQVYVIRHKVLVEGKSERSVAQEMGVSRNTVRRYVEGAAPGEAKKRTRSSPVRDKVGPKIDALLEAWSTEVGGKQRITSARVYEELCKLGCKVGTTFVKEYIREWRRERREVFVPLEYHAGDLAQVDFFEVWVTVQGKRRKAFMFVMRLMYSGRDFACLYPRQDQVCFLDGHVRAFQHFGATPHRIAYDNLRAAVKKMLVGSMRELSVRFAALASHYLFEPCFARPRTGHDKGGVEARGRTIRLQELVPIPRGESLEALSVELQSRLDARGDRNRSGSDETIEALFEREKPQMLIAPEHAFRASAMSTVQASRRSLCRIARGSYSVWSRWAGLQLTAYVGAREVVVVGPDGSRVTHPRLFGERTSIDYRHYLPELAKKPQAVRQVAGSLIRDLGPPFDRVWRHLVDEYGPREAARIFARVLKAVVELGHREVVQRLVRALDDDEPLMFALRPPPTPEVTLAQDALPAALRTVAIDDSSAADFDVLLEGGAS